MDIACDHAKAARYVSLMLWTNAQLVAARALYDAYNFKMIETKRSFLSQQWVKEEKWVRCLKDI
ncbi:hypothetical protein SAMN05421737_102181 [Shouchella lonarensis]|uniref:Acetyltransferase (GNAT) family protein n=1 Tax=Shouchella lonarensis TaxID=1464122 RepID=A0A1G6H1P8_9BACI|nr:hypothetical protein [Shouchella lonarensis]SDB87316.1 hypothetical protein SAMN05421737_102181 [Shouchella lonarensis]